MGCTSTLLMLLFHLLRVLVSDDLRLDFAPRTISLGGRGRFNNLGRSMVASACWLIEASTVTMRVSWVCFCSLLPRSHFGMT